MREIRRILAAAGCPVEVESLEEARVRWKSDEERIEEHDSFLANARAKAEYFARLTGRPTVADDSGIEVITLGGAPGVRSRRFAPESGRLTGKELDAANNAELLRRLRGAEQARRRACYVCVAVLLRTPSAPPESFTGRSWGSVLQEPRGSGGFGYDPLFLHESLGKSFGEAAADEKDAVSHRGEAFRQVAAALAARPL